MSDDASLLRAACTALRGQRDALQTTISVLEGTRASTTAEITHLVQQRSELELDISLLLDDVSYLRSGDSRSASDSHDAHGRVVRRLCAATQTLERLRDELESAQGEAAANRAKAEEERSFRETLAARVRDLEAGSAEAVLSEQIRVLKAENADVREAARADASTRRKAQRQVESLRERLVLAEESARDYASVLAERDALKARLEEKGSPRALLALSPNILPAPTTPTKKSKTASNSKPASPSPAPVPGTPSTLATRHEYLQRKHAELKLQFDAMRTKYAKDIQHWKEFRAIQQARHDVRAKRRAERATATGEGSLQSGESAPLPSNFVRSLPPTPAQARATPAEAKPVKATPVKLVLPQEENEESAPIELVAASPSPAPSPATPARPPTRSTASAPVPASQKRVSLKAASTPAKAVEKGPSRRKDAVIDIDMDMDVDGDVDMDTPKRVLALAAPTTPAPMTSASERRQPARVTPWLGTTRKSESSRSASTSTSRRGATTVDFSDDEEDDVPPLRQGVHTPLVRDRTGSMGGSTGSTNLRRRALQRRAAETPDTSTKRKADDTLDHSLLSPAERARVRKQLSRLSTAERRELYAPYKGKGRYVAPAQLNRTAADEFEVDPEKNGGVGHQFHEVVRNRAERRKMHGGDCECCRDYYEAVGPLPRFSHAPIWRDEDPEGDEGEGDEMEMDEDTRRHNDLVDHQNRISRHREVWRKPPTPPDYWKIGFPSTQDVARVNEQADEMARKRDAEIRREAAHKDSKWRKKT